MEIEEARRKLRTYRALDNEIRLKALAVIHERPGISFNEISRKVKVERGLLAYHLGVLKAAGIVNVDYERTSKQTSKYEATDEGRKLIQELRSKLEPKEEANKGKTRKS